jgi:hypothetical protein
MAVNTLIMIRFSKKVLNIFWHLVGVQENHNADAEITEVLSDFENKSELEYTDEEYLNEDDLELDSNDLVNKPVLNTRYHRKPGRTRETQCLYDVNRRRTDGFRFLLQSPSNCGKCIQDDPEI